MDIRDNDEEILLTYDDMRLLLEAVSYFDREDMNKLYKKLLDICMLSYDEKIKG